mmetsp:Transcript_3065/g.5020  ORF Transcript_3065/g.5020 Transcript_3065/m.5020 type:complete len:326 (+) Transcript_3065:322-1299(+)
MESSGTNVFNRLVQQRCHAGHFTNGIVLHVQCDTFSGNELNLLTNKVRLWFRQNLVQIIFRQTLQFDSNWKTPLQLGQHVTRSDSMKGTTGHKQNVIRVDVAILSADSRSFNEGKQITLDAFGTGIGTARRKVFAGTNLVNFINEDNATFFDCCNGLLFEIDIFQQLVQLQFENNIARFRDWHFLSFHGNLVLATSTTALSVAHATQKIRHGSNVWVVVLTTTQTKHATIGSSGATFRNINFDFLFIQQPLSEHITKRFPPATALLWSRQEIQNAILHQFLGLLSQLFRLFLFRERHTDIHQIPNNLIHIPSMVSHFGEFSCFHF